MKRICTGCGKSFETMDLRKTRCKKNCSRSTQHANAARTRRRDDHELTFIGVDGEGWTDHAGEHRYNMLSVGDETLTSSFGRQLQWEEIFDFLWQCFEEDKQAAYCGFFLGYDFTQWLRTLPEERARRLLTTAGRTSRKRTAPGTEHLPPFPVEYRGWEFDLLGMKRFKLRPKPREGSKGGAWMYINDTGPFFQTSFLNVIDPRNWTEPICTPEEHQLIIDGKAARGRPMTVEEEAVTRNQVARYNTLENDILSRVLTRLNEGFTAAGVRLRTNQWYGPGQAAQAWMHRIEAPTAEDVQAATPRDVLEAARASYYGGWFEIFAHGHVPGVSHEYDINSAYPHVISQLPCLLHGRWVHTEDASWVHHADLSLVFATVTGTDPRVGAMPHREKDGRVLRPSTTRGWFWDHEIKAAMTAGIIAEDGCNVSESWNYIACDCPPPFRDEMLHLYQERLKVGKNTAAGKAYKLVYNSVYGKVAQSIGQPKYANPIYASLITAGCRTMILEAIATHPRGTEDLLMVATDGVYFATPHPGLELSANDLGAWDHTEKRDLTLFMPGVYWDERSRDTLQGPTPPRLKSRGVSARDLARCINQLDEQFTGFGTGQEWPSVKIPVAFTMTTATQALARGDWSSAGHVSSDETKKLSSDPKSKRVPGMLYRDDRGCIHSYPYTQGTTLETTPYDRRFGLPEQDEGVSQDGTTAQEDLRNMLLR